MRPYPTHLHMSWVELKLIVINWAGMSHMSRRDESHSHSSFFIQDVTSTLSNVLGVTIHYNTIQSESLQSWSPVYLSQVCCLIEENQRMTKSTSWQIKAISGSKVRKEWWQRTSESSSRAWRHDALQGNPTWCKDSVNLAAALLIFPKSLEISFLSRKA